MNRTIELIPLPCGPGRERGDFQRGAYVTGRCRHGSKWHQYVLVQPQDTGEDIDFIRDTTPAPRCTFRFHLKGHNW